MAVAAIDNSGGSVLQTVQQSTPDAANSGSSTSGTSRGVNETWYSNAKKTILDLNTSDDQLINFFSQEFQNSSPAQQAALQQLQDQRQRVADALTQLIRSLGETARQIINNIR